jgi:hypothetical protein
MANKQTTSADPTKELVDKYINSVDEKGKLVLPDELSPVEKELVRQAKRTRDAQSALSKERLERAKLAATNAELEKLANSIIPEDFTLSPEELKELDEIKFKDPDAYRIRLNKLEAEAKKKQADKIRELTEKAQKEAENQAVSKTRIEVLEEFRKANPDIPLTDDVLVNDIPPRFMNELNAGKYDYSTYLQKVAEYLKTGKVVAQPGATEEHNLGNLAGGKTPGQEAANKQGKQDYKKITF